MEFSGEVWSDAGRLNVLREGLIGMYIPVGLNCGAVGNDTFIENIVAIDEGLYCVVEIDGLLEGLEIGVAKAPEVVVVEIVPGSDDGFSEGVVEIICVEEELEELVELVLWMSDGSKVSQDGGG